MKNAGNKFKSTAKYLCYVAVMAATLTVSKLALSFIPNVEVVTLLIICYASVFGRRYTIFATMIFCAVETAIYGFGTWVLLYFIYWNLLAVVSSLSLTKPKLYIAVIIAVLFTASFGVISTGIDVVFAGVYGVPKSDLGRLFGAYYVRGVWFYVTHVVSNLLIVSALYLPLTKVLTKIKTGNYLEKNKKLPTDIKNEYPVSDNNFCNALEDDLKSDKTDTVISENDKSDDNVCNG